MDTKNLAVISADKADCAYERFLSLRTREDIIFALAYCLALGDARKTRLLFEEYDGTPLDAKPSAHAGLFTDADHAEAAEWWGDWLPEAEEAVRAWGRSEQAKAVVPPLRSDACPLPPEAPPTAFRAAPSLPPNLPPRGLTKAQAAAYVGCATVRGFEDRIARGVFPSAMPGTRVWDRNALDAAMDRLSGLSRPAAADPRSEAERALAEWEAKYEAH